MNKYFENLTVKTSDNNHLNILHTFNSKFDSLVNSFYSAKNY